MNTENEIKKIRDVFERHNSGVIHLTEEDLNELHEIIVTYCDEVYDEGYDAGYGAGYRDGQATTIL